MLNTMLTPKLFLPRLRLFIVLFLGLILSFQAQSNEWDRSLKLLYSQYDHAMGLCFKLYPDYQADPYCKPYVVESFNTILEQSRNTYIDPRIRLCLKQKAGELAQDLGDYAGEIKHHDGLESSIEGFGYCDKFKSLRKEQVEALFEVVEIGYLDPGTEIVYCHCYKKSDKLPYRERACKGGTLEAESCGTCDERGKQAFRMVCR